MIIRTHDNRFIVITETNDPVRVFNNEKGAIAYLTGYNRGINHHAPY